MKILLKIFLAIIAFIVIVALLSPDEASTASASTNDDNSVEENISKSDSTFKAEQLERLQAVKKSFNYREDEFNGGGWYTHKLWGKNFLNRNGLVCKVNNSGYIYLESNYFGDDWIFHDRIQVKIGDQVYQTEAVPFYEKNNIHENNGGSVWEVVQYTNQRDNGITNAIAFNTDKTIKVRFIGQTFNKDITLNLNDKKAIEECQRLADLLILTK